MKKMIFTLAFAFSLGTASYTVASVINSGNDISKVLDEKDKDKKKKKRKKADAACCSAKETKACSGAQTEAKAKEVTAESGNAGGAAPEVKSCCKGAAAKACGDKKKEVQ